MQDSTSETPRPSRGQSLAIPMAIIIGFGLIAAAIFFSGNQVTPTETTTKEGEKVVDQTEEVTGTINPLTDADHIKGNPNAPIVIIEYSDFDCPFCKNFHETMTKVVDEFGVDGKVAWAYRHFPLEQLHPSAPYIAAASECVALQGGDEAFWKFADLVFGERSTNEPTNIARLPEFAEKAGVDVAKFNTCLETGETKAAVEEDFTNGVSIGARGTPYSVILIGNQQFPINGAQPYNVVRQMIEGLIRQLSAAPAGDAAQ